MALPALASLDQFEDWIGEEIPESGEPRAEFALSMASTLVRAYTGLDWVDENDDLVELPDAVWQVTVMAAARLWQNPEGRIQETTGPFSTTIAGPSKDNAALYLTKTEKELLDDPAVAGTRRPGLFTLEVTRGGSIDGTSRSVVNDQWGYVL